MSATDPKTEPHDRHSYGTVYFPADGFAFHLRSLRHYGELLRRDRHAIDGDPDLKQILGDMQAAHTETSFFELDLELDRVERQTAWMEKKLADTGKGYEVLESVNHGWVRWVKSAGILYLSYLRERRDAFARRRPSLLALTAVDQTLARFESLLSSGVFSKATPMALLVEQASSPSEHADAARTFPAAPAPVVLGTIEVLDPTLRRRCLDLFAKFREDGEHERLDTVVNEATRILEARLCTASGAQEAIVGVDLATYAFGGDTPRIRLSTVPAEQKAAHLLFRGAFGFIRNHVHHQLVTTLSPERTLQLVGMVDYLLSLLEQPTGTPAQE